MSTQALCGCVVDVPTLSGERVTLNMANEVIRPSTQKRIVGQVGVQLAK